MDQKLLQLDFRVNPEIVRTLTEGERLTYGHLFNPTFATEISLIDPLPHQRIAVYQNMLGRSPLRFLLADDAGAGKTIMAGLYLREMLSRRLLRRVLIVTPAGLVSNWEREMNTLFNLPFRVIEGNEARTGNPFSEDESDLLIISVDTLAGDNVFRRLQESNTNPYELVIFDEAHKLSASRDPDLRVRKTNRYKLAEALAGVQSEDERWQLDWSCQHVLLLTATPHMGKDYPYYALWRLLEPEALSTPDAFEALPAQERQQYFLRRTKEEMVYPDGQPLYPPRQSDTLSYELTQGDISEQTLYDETTQYMKTVYNRARFLNRSAARLAMGIFQRRLASSTYALMCSLQRRYDKLSQLIEDVETGKLDLEALDRQQKQLELFEDIFEAKTADEEETDEQEENEVFEEEIIGGIVETSLAQLESEQLEVENLLDLAKQVYALGSESKFEKLREVVRDPDYRDEKILIFTEHRDTLRFLVARFEALGFTGQIAQIHGGMPYSQRDEQIEFFRKPARDGGATYMIATDAAGEGLNMQFCRIMINYDIPWNPARLEQRMGRIHRYGQKYPVTIINLIAGNTREGRVLKTLLEKLERIRKELSSDKVFDVIGRVLQGVSLKDYMEQSLEQDTEEIVREVEQRVSKERIIALQRQERAIFGERDDVISHLPQISEETAREPFFHLLPGYVRRYTEKAVPLLGLSFEGNLDSIFSLKAAEPGAMEPFFASMENYPIEKQNRFTFYKPHKTARDVVLMHPGEAVFEQMRQRFYARYCDEALHGAVFTDPDTRQPYTFHLARITIVRRADPDIPGLSHREVLEQRLIGLRQSEDGHIEEYPVEHLMILQGGKYSNDWLRFVVNADHIVERARQNALTVIGTHMADYHRDRLLNTLDDRRTFVAQGYAYHESDLANARTKQAKKANEGNKGAQLELTRVKKLQHSLDTRRQQALALIEREPELIVVEGVHFIAHALVLPADDPKDRERNTKEIEAIAVQMAMDYERAYHSAIVTDVSTPASARAAGLKDNPGFDLLSKRPDGSQLRIEVKGRARAGEVEVSENEWAAACNLRDSYWLYVVFDCATAHPRLLRVCDPFQKLITQSRGVRIDENEILKAAEE
jgi:SNF2 family DNA or RNA helicase